MIQPKLFESPGAEFAPAVVLDRDGLVTYDPYFLDPGTADHAFHSLIGEIGWSQEFLSMYGRRIPFPRLTAWYGDRGAAYTYSGVKNEPRPWTPLLRLLRDRVTQAVGARFNSVLLNRYRDGQDSLSWHADDERELGDDPVIASLSLGIPRVFRLKHRADSELRELVLGHGSLLVMTGATQQHWLHCVPKERNLRGQRINLTFRVIDAGNDKSDSLRTDSTVRPRGKVRPRG